MEKNLAFVLSYRKNPSIEAAVASHARPCPDYLLFVKRTGAALITYDDVEQADPGLARILEKQGILNWSCPRAVFGAPTPYRKVVAAVEEVGLPLAVDACNHELKAEINIITHGFLHDETRLLRSLQNYRYAKFLCLSSAIREMLLTRFSLPEQSVLTVGCGVDTGFFAPEEQPVAPVLVASPGVANRDFRTLVRAMHSIDARLCIAAKSEWTTARVDIGGDSLPANIEYVAYTNYADIRNLYARSICVVVPLYPVPFASGYLVIHEAMAMGKPVIVTRTECPSDVLVDGENGFYVRPGDVGDLRDKIQYMLDHPEIAVKMGKRARKKIEIDASLPIYCERLERAIEEAFPARQHGQG